MRDSVLRAAAPEHRILAYTTRHVCHEPHVARWGDYPPPEAPQERPEPCGHLAGHIVEHGERRILRSLRLI